MSVHAYSDDCRFHKPLDLPAFAERIGADNPAMSPDLRKVLVCTKCHSKRTSFIYSPDRGEPQIIEGAWSGPPRTAPQRLRYAGHIDRGRGDDDKRSATSQPPPGQGHRDSAGGPAASGVSWVETAGPAGSSSPAGVSIASFA
jgi:hypothetical protein